MWEPEATHWPDRRVKELAQTQVRGVFLHLNEFKALKNRVAAAVKKIFYVVRGLFKSPCVAD